MSSQIANSRCICAKTAGSACSIPPSVSSLNTTPKPNVSSAAFRSQTVISCCCASLPVAASCWARAREVEAARAPADHRDPHVSSALLG